jgi:hypothetical protein
MLFSDRYQPNESQRRTPNRMRAGRRDAANPERCRFRVVVRATWGAAASAPASPAVPPFDAAARTRMAHSVQRKDALDANLVGCHATSRPSLDSQATRTSPSLQASRCAPWRRVRSGDIDHAPAKRWEQSSMLTLHDRCSLRQGRQSPESDLRCHVAEPAKMIETIRKSRTGGLDVLGYPVTRIRKVEAVSRNPDQFQGVRSFCAAVCSRKQCERPRPAIEQLCNIARATHRAAAHPGCVAYMTARANARAASAEIVGRPRGAAS